MKYIIAGILFLLIFTSSFAQGGPSEPGPCSAPPCNEIYPELPIDGGISLLLIAGAAFGVYTIRKKLTIND